VSAASSSVAGITARVPSRWTSGSPAAAAQAVRDETPGTTVTGYRGASRVKIPAKLP